MVLDLHYHWDAINLLLTWTWGLKRPPDPRAALLLQLLHDGAHELRPHLPQPLGHRHVPTGMGVGPTGFEHIHNYFRST